MVVASGATSYTDRLKSIEEAAGRQDWKERDALVDIIEQLGSDARDSSKRDEMGQAGAVEALSSLISSACSFATPTATAAGPVATEGVSKSEGSNGVHANGAATKPSNAVGVETAVRVMLPAARAVRNLCANFPANQDRAREAGMIETAAKALDWLLEVRALRTMEDPQRAVLTLRTMAQLVGNLVASNPTNQAATWSKMFPSVLLGLLSCGDEPTFATSCMILFNCCLSDSNRLREVLTASSGAVARTLLSHLAAAGAEANPEVFEWCFYLLSALLSEGLLPELLDLASSIPEATAEVFQFLANVHLHPVLGATRSKDAKLPLPLDSLKLLASLVSSVPKTLSDPSLSATTERPLLRELHVWRLQMQCVAECTAVSDQRVQDIFVQCGALTAAADALKLVNALPPYQDPSEESEEEPTEPENARQVMFGLQTDLLRVIANLSFGHTEAQNMVREMDAQQVILEYCGLINDSQPQMHEWAVMAVRGLCEKNTKNQNAIAALQQELPERTST